MADDEMTVPEAAAHLKIDRSVVLRAVQRGRIPARRVGQRLWLIRRDEVLAYDITREKRGKKGDE